MPLTLRQKQWAGALASTVIQTALFIPVDIFAGHWISALMIACINIGLAASYKHSNPYLVGARWAAFFNMGLVSVARHTYWYEPMLESFIRLRDFNRPLDMMERLCAGTTEAAIITVSTSVLILVFYYFTPKWNEWHGRWEMLRRAPFSASLGFQVVIMTTVVYPTPLTMTTALFFASVVSPIIRRQVRLNHVVFMMMVPLFSLGSPPLALFWSLVCGLLFLYFVSIERSFTTNVASFTFFNGVAFIALFVSTIEDRLKPSGALVTGVYALFAFSLLMGLSYLLLVKGQHAIERLREAQLATVPSFIRRSSWWDIRDLWVDREVAHRTGKLYKWKEMDKSIGMFFFGPREWADRSDVYDEVPYPRVNVTPTVLVLTVYAVFLGVDAVLFLTTGDKFVTVSGLLLTFIVIIASPLLLLSKQWRDRAFYKAYSFFGATMTLLILGLYMAAILYSGLTTSTTLNNAADNLNARTAPAITTTGVTDEDCTCQEQETPMGMPGLAGR